MNAYALSVDDVMVLYGMTRANVYRVASLDRWRRLRDDTGRVMYHPDDVGRSMQTRPRREKRTA